MLFKCLALIFAKLFISRALTTLKLLTLYADTCFSPLFSAATLAFFAVCRVLIKDFFWMDIVRSTRPKILSLFQTRIPSATGVPN